MSPVTYSHRNNEEEPPTVAGRFWFDGEVSYDIADDSLPHYPVRDLVLLVEERDVMYVLCDIKRPHVGLVTTTFKLSGCHGKWSGPVVAPWAGTSVSDCST